MRKLLLMPLILGLFCISVCSQEEENKTFTFADETSNFDFTEKPANLEDHFLGKKIAIKLYYLQNTYTYIEKGTSTSPSDKTVVLKPAIYYSIKKINSRYKKEIRKGIITKEEARKNLDKCLYVALAIFYQDTEEFENDLKSYKKPDEIVAFFNRVELN